MRLQTLLKALVVLLLVIAPAMTRAQQLPNPYGAPVSLENAKKAAAAAIAEAEKLPSRRLARRRSSSAPRKRSKTHWRLAETGCELWASKVPCRWKAAYPC
jgi:hypothetical protein